MQNNYERALKPVLVHEGGKVDDRNDPGGRTNKGVTQRVYTAFRLNQGLASRDVYDMDPIECNAIYKMMYWDKVHGDELRMGLDYVVFDAAVNSGPNQAAKWLQRALNLSVIDGNIGPVTLRAATTAMDVGRVINAVCDERLAFMQRLKTWKFYSRGWSSRVAEVRKIGLHMAPTVVSLYDIAPVATFFDTGENQKAREDDLTTADKLWGALGYA